MLQQDLQFKVQSCAKRLSDKQKLLSILPKTEVIASCVEASPQSNTRQQIKQVIAKEESIEVDLKACLEKLSQIKHSLSEKVHATIFKKTTELNAITQLVQLISQTFY